MPAIEVRPFRRRDRDQLTQLVNAHAAAVVPGGVDHADFRAFLPVTGFRELTRTRRGWTRARQPPVTGAAPTATRASPASISSVPPSS